MKNIIDLTGRKILVTGASSGIGRETSILLSQIGADVMMIGRNGEELEKTFEKMEEGKHKVFSFDLSNLKDISLLIDRIVSIDDRKLNGLVHCAGISVKLPLRNLDYKAMDETMRINYYSYIELVKNYALRKNSSGGSIVGISSIASPMGEKAQTNYSASKAAMDAATRTLAQELCSKGIRINTVLPGMTKTKMTQKTAEALEAGEKPAVMERQLLGMCEPIDIANMVAFLLSDASRFITGRSFYVDGGRF
ncbi:MAG: SDR family oxidoreductase [Thiohalomonadaceae bacterium]